MPASPRRRVILLALGLLVTTLVPVVVAGSLAVRAAGREQSALAQREASAVAAGIAARVDQTLHERATVLRLTATSSVIVELYRHPYRAGTLHSWVTTELARVRALDPDLTGELCLLDGDGTERAKLVRGRSTEPAALSAHQAERVWQAPSLALRPGQAHQQGPYVSPDTGSWVISTSVPVVVNKRPLAVLHSEIGLEQLRTRLLGSVPPGRRARVVDPADGTVVIDTLAATPTPTPGTDLLTQWLPRARPLVSDPARDGDLVQTAGTANGWQVEVLAEPAGGVPPRLLGLLAALASLTVSGCVVLAHRLGRREYSPPLETPFDSPFVPIPRRPERSVAAESARPESATTGSATQHDQHPAEQGERAEAGTHAH